MTINELENIVGGLSQTSKMPCPSWSISASRCQIGSKLANAKGSICEGCYAQKGAYAWSSTQTALERRWNAYRNDRADWVECMSQLIKRKKLTHFRWFDSGDLQSCAMLGDIAEVANRAPDCQFWLPTKEHQMVQEWLKAGNIIPSNLTIRLSAYMRDRPVVGYDLPTSTVTDKEAPIGYPCPSKEQGNKCLNCRACWNPAVKTVSYFWH